MIITLDGGNSRIPVGKIDLGEPSDYGYFDQGYLAQYGGNIYILVDGVEYGSLFFYRRPDGTMTISLGAFDAESDEWVEHATLDKPVEA